MRSITRAAILVVVSCVLFLISPTPYSRVVAQTDVPRIERADCMFTLPEGIVDGVDVACGYLVVPERYENPDGPTLRLAVAVISSESINPRPDPIVFNQGGPGGSTIDYFTQVLFDSPLRKNRELVLFDQRGTLYSKPALMCPEFLEETIKVLDKDLSDEENNRLFAEAAKACRDRLMEDGINLSAFNSLENARDIESLRLALGYEKINLYGVSYGTLLALHTMRDYPQGLRSVILDAVVPTQVDFNPEGVRTMDRSFKELFAACAADSECAAEYPDLESVFFEQVERLDADPVMVRLTDVSSGQSYPALINGDALIQTLFQTLYSTELLPLLPKMIYDVKAGRFTFMERILSIITFDQTVAEGMYYSVICAEDSDFDPDAIDYAGIPPRLVEGERAANEAFIQVCRDWNVDQLDDSVDDPVASDIPTLLLNGRFDPITPESYGSLAAQTLSNSYIFTFNNTGHGAIGDECADQVMKAFVDDPSRPPDGRCAGEGRIDYITGRDVIDFPVLIKALNLDALSLAQLGLLILSVLFLLTAWLVFPLAWIVRLVSGKEGRSTPFYGHLAPWVSLFLGLLGLVFVVGLTIAGSRMVSENDILILMGVSTTYRWVFFFPLLFALTWLVFFLQWLGGLAGRYWAGWRKVYYTLLMVAGLACLVVFLVSGALVGWLA